LSALSSQRGVLLELAIAGALALLLAYGPRLELGALLG
jgi:hypothetical protein